MKNFVEIINQNPIYMNDWSNAHKENIIDDFEELYWKSEEEKTEIIKGYDVINILFASYGNANYTGDAWVLFEKNGKLYEINAGHCSCYGLEGQWEPEEVQLIELENRLLNGTFGEDDWSDNNFKEELCKFLGVEFRKNI